MSFLMAALAHGDVGIVTTLSSTTPILILPMVWAAYGRIPGPLAWVGAVLSVPFALFINGIELLVAFLQAYIFTMLTSLFIGMSAHPQH